MRKLLFVLLALASITLGDPLVASSHDDDNEAAPGVGRAGSTNSGLALSSHPFLSETNVRSFNLDSLIFSRELGLFRPLQTLYMQAMEDLAQQTGNPTLFRQDHTASYSHFTLAQLEELVKQKTLKGALDTNKQAGRNYFNLKMRLKDPSTEEMDYDLNTLLLCPPLRDATHLEMLSLSNNRLITLPEIYFLTNLLGLHLQNNQLVKVPRLDTLTKLKRLCLEDNQLTTVPGLNALINLETLRLPHNKLTTLPGLGSLTKVEYLDLRNNQLRTLPGLENLTNLQTLDLSDNQLVTLPGLENLTNLQMLDLAYNEFTTLPGLNALINLQRLYLERNHFTALPGLEALINLQGLRLDKRLTKKMKILRPLVALIDHQVERNLKPVRVRYKGALLKKIVSKQTLGARLMSLSGDGEMPVER